MLTAASVHDSQVAIPMIKMTSAKVTYLYDLMDPAYDARQIYEVSKSLGHVPIIDKNSRGKDILRWLRMKRSGTTSAQRWNVSTAA